MVFADDNIEYSSRDQNSQNHQVQLQDSSRSEITFEMSKVQESDTSKLLLITANVGSLFENVSNYLFLNISMPNIILNITKPNPLYIIYKNTLIEFVYTRNS